MEPAALPEESAVQSAPLPSSSDASGAAEPATPVVRDFAEISALLAAAPPPEGETSEAG